MKKSIYSLLIGVLVLSSCSQYNSSENKEVSPSEFLEIKSEIQNDQAFIDLRNSNLTFFNQLRNQEIDLFEIHNYIVNNNLEINTKNSVNYYGDFSGVEKFISAVSSRRKNLQALFDKFEALQGMDEPQILEIFTSKKPDVSLKRGEDCLEQFQFEWSTIDILVTDATFAQDAQDIAIGMYEDCCSNGGSGCP